MFTSRVGRRAAVRRLPVAVLTAVLAAASLTGGCAPGTASTGGQPGRLRVGLVTDPGGLNDRSFNWLANRGLQQAERTYRISGRVVTSTTNADFLPNLSALARQHYDLVIAVGFQMTSAVDTAAKAFPKTKFAIIDVAQDALASKPANVEGVVFQSSQSGYLAGYLAGLYVKAKGGRQVVSSVAGKKIPPVDAYVAGFQAGARAADPGITTLNDYSQDFTDQAACKARAVNQIGAGSQVVFAVASQCGLGAISAAGQAGIHAIGVDADQSYLGPYVLTSALKKVDVAVIDLVKQATGNAFKAGQTTTYDLRTKAVGLGTMSADAARFSAQLRAVTQQIASGAITIPQTLR